MLSHFGSYISSHCKRITNEFIKQIGGFFKNSIYYGDTDSIYIHQKYWSIFVDKGLIDKYLGSDKNGYGNSGIFYALSLAAKVKFCLEVDKFGAILAKKLSKDIER